MIIVSDKVGKIIIRKIEKDCGLADVEYKPVELVLANANDAEKIWEMQKIAFAELFAKYKDKDTSPATETLEKVQSRFDEANTYHYFIQVGGDTVGALRIVDKKTDEFKRVSQIFVMPEYRRKGYALSAITIAESIHGENKWEAETILNERALCMFYTRMGYRINKEKSFNRVNDKMTLITFVKY
ncbi:MAG: GNAT family N-acetyltransferase [Clostridia bacterium]|nr:GNAT family N-acetyltransferase [Clostridia bacterium]MDE7328777.1 GNAT family N-acetyltransferase [Clostridia bacterium]